MLWMKVITLRAPLGCHCPGYFCRLQRLLSISAEKRMWPELAFLPIQLESSHSGAAWWLWCQASPIGYPIPGSLPHAWFAFRRTCQLQRARAKGGAGGGRQEGSFSQTNTVTQLPIKWVTSCTQKPPLLSTSVPPYPPTQRWCDYVTGAAII